MIKFIYVKRYIHMGISNRELKVPQWLIQMAHWSRSRASQIEN